MASGNPSSGFADLLYVSVIDGTPLTSATPTNIEPANSTNPGAAIPSQWLNQAYDTSRSLSFVAKGVVSTAASTPGTLTMAVAVGATPTVLCASPAVTPAVSLSNGYWEIRGDLVVRSAASAGLLQCSAVLTMANGATATTDMVSFGMPQNLAAASWPVAADATVAGTYVPLAFHIRATWSTAPAGDSIACLTLKLWADN